MLKRKLQKIEYTSSWQEKCFEWICGYANAKGGTLHIGVNDDGYVAGLEDVTYLLDALPNIIADTMGIVVEIDCKTVQKLGTNIKYRTIPEDIAPKPENLYVRGVLTKKALDDIEAAPSKTKNVSPEVSKLFNAAPNFVKQLRQSADYRAKVKADIDKWTKEELVNIDETRSLKYVTIHVPSYPYGISYHNHYFTHSGNTTREVERIALSSFLMERAGRYWDGMPMSRISTSNLDANALDAYRKKSR